MGIELEQVLVSERFLRSDEGRALAHQLPSGVHEVAEELLSELADADSPQGLLAVARLPRHGVDALPIRSGGTYLVAEALQDPGNVGALARVAEAVGVSALCLTAGSAHPNHPRALRASAGSLLRVPVSIETNLSALCAHLKSVFPLVVALAPREGRDLYRVSELVSSTPQNSVVLCIGSEGAGLSAESLLRADMRWTIPMEAPVESLNVTVAAALALFELRRRREWQI